MEQVSLLKVPVSMAIQEFNNGRDFFQVKWWNRWYAYVRTCAYYIIIVLI